MSMLAFSEEVDQARREGAPVVALESTIISHGMPWPKNMETALSLEDEVRQGGAVPATVAIMDGCIRIGLSRDKLETFARADDVTKVSRRDLPVVLAQKQKGATTVAATMICAKMAEIRVFATGGIGGVHRGGEASMDVSADLMELARTEVAVVCAGAKAILDLGRTLEYLETHGVPVLGYKTEAFPAFYTRDSGFPTHASVHSPEEAAAVLNAKWSLGLEGGAVIANPVPQDAAMESAEVDIAIGKALAEAMEQNVTGKDITPFLLSRMEALTEGRSLKTNMALVRHNARVAASISVALNQLGSDS